jgi:hypothetical protein
MFPIRRRFVLGVYGRIPERDIPKPKRKLKRYVIDCGPEHATHYAHTKKQLDFVLKIYPGATVTDLEATNDN